MQIDIQNKQKISNSANNINNILEPKSTANNSSNSFNKTIYLLLHPKKGFNLTEQEDESKLLGHNKIFNINDVYSINPSLVKTLQILNFHICPLQSLQIN